MAHSREELLDIARGAIERDLDIEDASYGDAYAVALNAILKHGIAPDIARMIASHAAQSLTQL